MRIQVNKLLPTDTSVHWHGLAIQNDMDGVPPVTQKAIPAGSGMLYHYVVPDPGTYWYHPHVGLQEDRGLYGPLIVDDPSESGAYDVEFVVILDDWVDGIAAQTPETVYTGLRSSKGTGGSGMSMGSSTAGSPLGASSADVAYQYYLINGKIPSAPVTLAAKPGQRARFRIINSAASTGFQVALGGHQMTVTHTDGYPVAPVTVDTLVLGMAERYDVSVTLGDGAFPFTAIPVGAPGQAMAVVRTASGAPPAPGVHPAELNG